MPRDLHFAHLGRLWSHLIFDLRQGSQDLGFPLRRIIPGNYYEGLYPSRAWSAVLKCSKNLKVKNLLHTPGMYLLTRCAPRLTADGCKTARMLYQFDVSASAGRDGGLAATAAHIKQLANQKPKTEKPNAQPPTMRWYIDYIDYSLIN